jgi:hypothetical protein
MEKMMSAESLKLSDAFGTTRDVPATYTERDKVDGRFLQDITRGKYLVIHGSSKQGKTSLRRHNLNDSDYVVLQCTRDTTKGGLYELLLKHADIKCETSHTTTLRGTKKLVVSAGVEGSIPFLTKGKGDYSRESGSGTDSASHESDFSIDPEDPNDVCRALLASGFSKYIFIEDFHYLDEDVQQQLAIDLKVFYESSKLVFIVVGVWLEANKLTIYNGDLSGRLAVINADEWPDASLLAVIEKGEGLLNISIPDSVKRLIVSECQGNVGLLQEVCYRACEQYGVWSRQANRREVVSVEDVSAILRALADDQSSRYRNFLGRFAEGLGGSELELYKWLGFVVVTATTVELRRGLRANTILHRIRDHHPNGETIRQTNVLQSLERVGKVQFKHRLQPFILDFSNNELVVVDAGFLVFRNTHSRSELLEYLGFENDPEFKELS